MTNSVNQYLDKLSEIVALIQVGSRSAALEQLPALIDLDRELSVAFLLAQAPILNAASEATKRDEAFESDYARMGQAVGAMLGESILLNSLLLQFAADPNAGTDSLFAQVDTLTGTLDAAEAAVSSLMESIALIPAAPLVLVKNHGVTAARVERGIPFGIEAIIRNASPLPADSITISFRGDSLTQLYSPAQLFIPRLGPDEERQCGWQLTVSDTTQLVGNYLIALTSSNAKTISANGFFQVSTDRVTAIQAPVAQLPSAFRLSQNHPNPFNSATVIAYQLPRQCEVSLKIYDVSGRYITTLVEGVQSSGFHEVRWNSNDSKGRPVATGVYIYKLTSDNHQDYGQMTLVK